jgi:hypothetical protein
VAAYSSLSAYISARRESQDRNRFHRGPLAALHRCKIWSNHGGVHRQNPGLSFHSLPPESDGDGRVVAAGPAPISLEGINVVMLRPAAATKGRACPQWLNRKTSALAPRAPRSRAEPRSPPRGAGLSSQRRIGASSPRLTLAQPAHLPTSSRLIPQGNWSMLNTGSLEAFQAAAPP